MSGHLFLLLVTLVLSAQVNCEAAEYIDLSYSFSEDTIFFPGQKDFTLSKDYGGWRDNDSWYSAYSFCMGEHGGTHLDAPFHFYRNGWTVEQIPSEHLIDVPATVIDIESRVQSEKGTPGEYVLTLEDILEHEKKQNFLITSRSVVLVYTGWSKYWGDKPKYLGNRQDGENMTLSFPGISEAAAKWLYNERNIVGIGIDTASVDPGSSKTYPVHEFLASKQVYNLENVANLHLLIAKECTSFNTFVLPLKIVGGTGAPARILAHCTRRVGK